MILASKGTISYRLTFSHLNTGKLPKLMEQKRVLIAFLLSALILLCWTFFAGKYAPQPRSGGVTSQSTNTVNDISQPQFSPVLHDARVTEPQGTSAPSGTLRRFITIDTPLYEAKFDSQGASASSWIIKRNKQTNRLLYSIASDKNNSQSLELVPSGMRLEAIHELPLQLSTGDEQLDRALRSRVYNLRGVEGDNGDVQLRLAPGESKTIEFFLHDDQSNLDVNKTIIFSADSYTIGVSAKVVRQEQLLTNIKLCAGPNFGDQGVSTYSFYSVAPEGIASVDGKVSRYYSKSIHETKDSKETAQGITAPDFELVKGSIDWAGVGDTYFAIVAIPPRPAPYVEFKTAKYDYDNKGKKEERHLISALLSIPADESLTRVYIGPKDHNLLTDASNEVTRASGPKVDLDGLINYGWLGFVSRYLAVYILQAINWLYVLTGSYGVAIILFTIVIYSLFFPLKWRSSRSMRKAQKHAPRMKELQEKLKGLKQTDPRLKELQIEQLRLMKEANPLGGCLPLLIQMPFLIALYTAITISIDFRQAPFLWIPDLSSAEPYTIHILPLIMAGSMTILQYITPAPTSDPLQRKMMAFLMPAFMLYILWSAPAGLLVYWIVGNIVGFSQQMLINRFLKSEDDKNSPPPEINVTTRQPNKYGPPGLSQA